MALGVLVAPILVPMGLAGILAVSGWLERWLLREAGAPESSARGDARPASALVP
jgi:hypothetical protein